MTNAASFVGSFNGDGATGVASLDPPLIQQTKSEIRSLAAEIAKLAHTAFEPAEFYSGFLPRLVTAMGAEAAAVWQTCSSLRKHGLLESLADDLLDQGLRLVAQHALPIELLSSQTNEDAVLELVPPSKAHQRILQCVIAEGAPILVPPHTVCLEAERPANPLEHSIIVVPVCIEDNVEFVLEVVQRASGGPAAQRGYLRFVAQMADLMADYLRRQSLREHALRASRLQQFEFWLSAVARASTPAAQLRNLADGLADLLDCQQVLIVRTGRNPQTVSASGLDTFDPRSETVLAAQAVEREALRAAEPPQICADLTKWNKRDDHLASLSNLQQAMASESVVRLQLDDRRGLVGILAFADSTVIPTPTEMQRVASSLVGLVGQAAAPNWMMPWWPARSALRYQPSLGRSSLQQWAMRAALAGLLTVIALFPVPQHINTTAVLAPKQKQVYYAPFDATVLEVSVSDNQSVVSGATLLRLANATLAREDERLRSEQESNRAALQQLRSEQHKERPSSDRLREILYEIASLESRMSENEEQQSLLKTELNKLVVKAVAPGALTTWDVGNRLLNRPVNAGDLLLSTYQPEGGWELQLSIPEHRVGLVTQALEDSAKSGVRIRYSLTSHPEFLLEGRLAKLAEQATRNAAGSNVVLGTAAVGEDLPMKKEGAIARVTIECGRVPAIWLVGRDAYWACVSRFKMIW